MHDKLLAKIETTEDKLEALHGRRARRSHILHVSHFTSGRSRRDTRVSSLPQFQSATCLSTAWHEPAQPVHYVLQCVHLQTTPLTFAPGLVLFMKQPHGEAWMATAPRPIAERR